MTEVKQVEWYEEIKARIEKIQSVTETIDEVLDDIKYDFESSVEVVQNQDNIFWKIKIDEYEFDVKYSDFKTLVDSDEIAGHEYNGAYYKQKEISLSEAIKNTLLEKFNWNINL